MKRLWGIILSVSLLLAWPGLVSAAEDAGRYKLGPGDVLEISIWKDDSLRREIVVPPDRVISFPLAGDIDVSNMDVAGLREEVAKKLHEFVPDATVTVLLLKINSLTAYVIGKVNQPGQFPINMDTTVIQLLSMAGGLNPFASGADIMILRKDGAETVKLPFNYDRVTEGKNLEQNIVLQRGDVIVVP